LDLDEKEGVFNPAYLKRIKTEQDILDFDERSPSTNVEAVQGLVRDNPGPLAELWNLDKG